MVTYTETTEGITISVQPIFLENRSNILKKEFFHVYNVTIENQGLVDVQLLRRRWLIHDSEAESYVVEGEGVVGETPLIKPGESHQYNSFCLLKSFEGSMEGSYQMKRDEGETFDVIIPRFYLRARCN